MFPVQTKFWVKSSQCSWTNVLGPLSSFLSSVEFFSVSLTLNFFRLISYQSQFVRALISWWWNSAFEMVKIMFGYVIRPCGPLFTMNVTLYIIWVFWQARYCIGHDGKVDILCHNFHINPRVMKVKAGQVLRCAPFYHIKS